MAKDNSLMDAIVSLCKRRGFVFQSSEIYGGLRGLWDYGPLGVELKRNIKEVWWRDMITTHDEKGNKVAMTLGNVKTAFGETRFVPTEETVFEFTYWD